MKADYYIDKKWVGMALCLLAMVVALGAVTPGVSLSLIHI